MISTISWHDKWRLRFHYNKYKMLTAWNKIWRRNEKKQNRFNGFASTVKMNLRKDYSSFCWMAFVYFNWQSSALFLSVFNFSFLGFKALKNEINDIECGIFCRGYRWNSIKFGEPRERERRKKEQKGQTIICS